MTSREEELKEYLRRHRKTRETDYPWQPGRSYLPEAKDSLQEYVRRMQPQLREREQRGEREPEREMEEYLSRTRRRAEEKSRREAAEKAKLAPPWVSPSGIQEYVRRMQARAGKKAAEEPKPIPPPAPSKAEVKDELEEYLAKRREKQVATQPIPCGGACGVVIPIPPPQPARIPVPVSEPVEKAPKFPWMTATTAPSEAEVERPAVSWFEAQERQVQEWAKEVKRKEEEKKRKQIGQPPWVAGSVKPEEIEKKEIPWLKEGKELEAYGILNYGSHDARLKAIQNLERVDSLGKQHLRNMLEEYEDREASFLKEGPELLDEYGITKHKTHVERAGAITGVKGISAEAKTHLRDLLEVFEKKEVPPEREEALDKIAKKLIDEYLDMEESEKHIDEAAPRLTEREKEIVVDELDDLERDKMEEAEDDMVMENESTKEMRDWIEANTQLSEGQREELHDTLDNRVGEEIDEIYMQMDRQGLFDLDTYTWDDQKEYVKANILDDEIKEELLDHIEDAEKAYKEEKAKKHKELEDMGLLKYRTLEERLTAVELMQLPEKAKEAISEMVEEEWEEERKAKEKAEKEERERELLGHGETQLKRKGYTIQVKPKTAAQKDFEKAIGEMVSPLPIIAFQGQEDVITPEIKERIRTERMAQMTQAKGEKIDEATDYEAMIYLHTASLAQPMSPMWGRIYMHLFKKFYPEKSDFIPEYEATLQDQDKVELHRLKQWLYKTARRK